MHQTYNDDDEFEPRRTPKPTRKIDCFAVPSVPEVSLVFDKPFKQNLHQKPAASPALRNTESMQITEKDPIFPQNFNGSYATWREQNFVARPFISKSEYGSTRKSHNSENYSPKESRKVLQTGMESSQTITQNVSTVYRNEKSYNRDYDNLPKPKQNDPRDEITRTQERQGCNSSSRSTQNLEMHSPILSTRSNNNLANVNFGQEKMLVRAPMKKLPADNTSHNENTFNGTEFHASPPIRYPYPYVDVNGYSVPQFYPAPYPPSIDNQETVKNLLQLVNNQSEQIKSLQLQVDRLLKMQEELLKEKQTCTCSVQLMKQNNQLCLENFDNANVPHSNVVQRTQQTTGNSMQNTSIKEQIKDPFPENVKNCHQSDLALTDVQKKKTFMEQKVSIGVMTSFEFTVQNNPFVFDSECYENNEVQRNANNVQMCNGVNVCSNNESVRRYKNSFARIPSGQLENIVEDSESYLSSSQPQSSHLNASISTKEIEKPPQAYTQKEAMYKSASPIQSQPEYNTQTNKTNQPLDNDYANERNIANRRDQLRQDVGNYELQNATTCPKSTVTYKNMNKQKLYNEKCEDMTNLLNGTNQYGMKQVSKKKNSVEDSLIFNSGDLQVNERPPTPEPSIHVEMNEYSSDDESERMKRTSKLGWTFYNNVIGQVNEILQNSDLTEDEVMNRKQVNSAAQEDAVEKSPAADTVKMATFEQLKKLGISLGENDGNEPNSNKAFDSSFYPRLDCQANMTQSTSAVNETNTSMHMKALALKYLSDEQLTELAVQKQGSGSLKQLMLSNVQGTNMSFATMRYLERYQLLPGKNNSSPEGHDNIHAENAVPPKSQQRTQNVKNNPQMRFPFNQTPRTTCPSKILDISTLKQQPKLL